MKKLFKLSKLKSNNSGFSLLEIIVASAIASIILLMVASSYRSILRSINRITGYAEFYENVNLALFKIDKDVTNAYFRRGNKKVTFIGEVTEGNSSMNFVTVSHKKFNVLGNIKKPFPATDIKEVGYYLKKDSETEDLFFLIRREDIHYDDDPVSGGDENIILENVISLKLEYKLRNIWTDNWDSRQNLRFPRAVKTTIKIMNYSKKEETFIFESQWSMNR